MRLPILLFSGFSAVLLRAEDQPFLYPQSDAFKQELATAKVKGFTLTDHHIHIRGGMTLEKAVLRQEQSGIRSAVLENFGREWPLSDNTKLKDFIDAHSRVLSNGRHIPVGIQVNDRDWFTQLDPALRQRLDFILADTMIMGLTAEGKPRRLWLPGVTIDDPEAWMLEYLAHNLRILDEPVSILANPTYLPPCIAHLYDQLWTEARMRQVIAKAVEKGVALEIQAGSDFPKPAFLKLAKSMGARFSFGSNNFDDKAKDLARWFEAIELLDLRPADLWAAPAPHDFAQWEDEIAAFERADRAQAPPQGAVLFIGSSTIRMWTSLARDFPKVPLINRGFGGSEIVDATHFAPRIIFPYAPRAIYLRSGGNDLWNGKSVEQVFGDFKDFVATVQAKLPATDIIFISLCPSIARWKQADMTKAVNQLIAGYVKGKPHLRCIDTYDMVLGPDGQPRPELFIADQLHFNAAGYKLLAGKVRPDLTQYQATDTPETRAKDVFIMPGK